MDKNEKLERLSKRYGASAKAMPMPKGPGGPGGPGGGPRGRMQGRGGKPKAVWPVLKRIMKYLAADKHKLIIAFVCVISASITNLIASYMLRPIINNFIDMRMCKYLPSA